jgi:uncharacterized protein YjbI with pentapeptide repeats
MDAPTITLERSKQRLNATHMDMTDSTFRKVNLSGSVFNDVNLSSVTVTNVNLAESSLSDVNLTNLKIRDANLSHASIDDSATEGMTINGILVSDLLAAYRAAKANQSETQ